MRESEAIKSIHHRRDAAAPRLLSCLEELRALVSSEVGDASDRALVGQGIAALESALGKVVGDNPSRRVADLVGFEAFFAGR